MKGAVTIKKNVHALNTIQLWWLIMAPILLIFIILTHFLNAIFLCDSIGKKTAITENENCLRL